MNPNRQLRQALSRVPAPPGFADRTVARVKFAGRSWWSSRAVMRLVASLIMVTTLGSLGYVYIDEQRNRRGEEAKEQLLLALRITAEKTEVARRAMEN